MSARFAAETTVPANRSRDEIERILERYGATSFAYGWDEQNGQRLVVVGFQLAERHIRLQVPMPRRADFSLTERGQERTAASAEAAYEQAVR